MWAHSKRVSVKSKSSVKQSSFEVKRYNDHEWNAEYDCMQKTTILVEIIELCFGIMHTSLEIEKNHEYMSKAERDGEKDGTLLSLP